MANIFYFYKLSFTFSADQEFYKYVASWEPEEAVGPIHVGVFELNAGLNIEDVVKISNWDNLNTFFKYETFFCSIKG